MVVIGIDQYYGNRKMKKQFKNFLSLLPSKQHWSVKFDSSRKVIDIQGTNNSVIIKRGVSTLNLKIVIHGNDNLLFIDEKCYIDGSVEMFGNANKIIIGRETIIMGVTLIAHGGKSIKIGKNCLIAELTNIRTTDSHAILNEVGERINPDESVEIGDRVWLTREVIVLRGAAIGSDVVIGTRSIVGKKILSNVVALGIPARVVRTGITWIR